MDFQAVHMRDVLEPITYGQPSWKSCLPPLSLDDQDADAFTQSEVPHTYDNYHAAEAPFICRVQNATIRTVQSLVFDNEHFYLDSYHNALLMSTILPVMPRVGPLQRHSDDAYSVEIYSVGDATSEIDQAVLLASPHPGNYHHWILETLPRLMAFDTFPHLAHLPIIV